jgi:hypothetical protein
VTNPVACCVDPVTGHGELGARQAAIGGEPLAGEPVELGDVGASPGEHGRVHSGSDVIVPGVDDGGERLGAARGDPEAVVVGVPVDRLGNIAGAQVGEDAAFGVVVLADVLPQHMHGVRLATHQPFEGTRRADCAELAVVADEDHLGPGHPGSCQEPEQGQVVGQSCFALPGALSAISDRGWWMVAQLVCGR